MAMMQESCAGLVCQSNITNVLYFDFRVLIWAGSWNPKDVLQRKSVLKSDYGRDDLNIVLVTVDACTRDGDDVVMSNSQKPIRLPSFIEQ